MPEFPFKSRIVPVWNALVHRTHRAAEYGDAAIHARRERCSVCGRRGWMLYRRRVIPPRLVELWGLTPRLARALARKESLDCSRCGAKLRARRLARVVLDLFPAGESPAQSIAEWVGRPDVKKLRIAEINRIDGLHDQLIRLPNLATSDYGEGATPGEVRDGVRHEDLTRLTYPDESFDLVLTSESLEHVPGWEIGAREILRVLKPGGRHVFTVPVLPGVPETFARSVVRTDGVIEHVHPRICHPGGDVGYPVFTEFGLDLPERLGTLGCVDVEVRFGPVSESDLAQVYVVRKSD